MNLLITAGGTSEKIDDVRTITNQSTGRLGKEIATAFLKNPENEIFYLCSRSAAKPDSSRCQIVEIESVNDLLNSLRRLLESYRFDAVIHSMAVSDYRLDGAYPATELIEQLTNTIISQIPDLSNDQLRQPTVWHTLLEEALPSKKSSQQPVTKISSDYETLYLKLEKAPKVIHEIKQLQPKTILVGFKLLVKTSEANLFAVAKKLLQKNKCDFVLANDLSQIDDAHHIGYLLSADGEISKGQTKKEIAQLIEEKITSQFKATRDTL